MRVLRTPRQGLHIHLVNRVVRPIEVEIKAEAEQVLMNGRGDARRHKGSGIGPLAVGHGRHSHHTGQFGFHLNGAVGVEIPEESIFVVAYGMDHADYQASRATHLGRSFPGSRHWCVSTESRSPPRAGKPRFRLAGDYRGASEWCCRNSRFPRHNRSRVPGNSPGYPAWPRRHQRHSSSSASARYRRKEQPYRTRTLDRVRAGHGHRQHSERRTARDLQRD